MEPLKFEAISMASDPLSRSSLSPLVVPVELHLKNCEKLVNFLRRHLTESSHPLHGFVFLQGGDEQLRHNTDHAEFFKQESYFAYLFGVEEPGFNGAIDIASGNSLLFAPRLPADYTVWFGEIKPLSFFKEKYKVTEAFYTDEISQVLNEQYRGTNRPLLFLLHGHNTDNNNFSKPAEFEGIRDLETDLTTLHPLLMECHVTKSDLEHSLIQFANGICSEAHVEVMRKTRVRMKEYQLGSMSLHHSYGGCRHCSYTCICATGGNSVVLQYGHAAAPNGRILEDGDMTMLDMGAEYHFYGYGITCSFPVNGKFTNDQSLIYSAVLEAHNAVISSMKPGVNLVTTCISDFTRYVHARVTEILSCIKETQVSLQNSHASDLSSENPGRKLTQVVVKNTFQAHPLGENQHNFLGADCLDQALHSLEPTLSAALHNKQKFEDRSDFHEKGTSIKRTKIQHEVIEFTLTIRLDLSPNNWRAQIYLKIVAHPLMHLNYFSSITKFYGPRKGFSLYEVVILLIDATFECSLHNLMKAQWSWLADIRFVSLVRERKGRVKEMSSKPKKPSVGTKELKKISSEEEEENMLVDEFLKCALNLALEDKGFSWGGYCNKGLGDVVSGLSMGCEMVKSQGGDSWSNGVVCELGFPCGVSLRKEEESGVFVGMSEMINCV